MFDSPTGIEQIIPLVGDMNLDTEIIVGSQEVDDLVSQMMNVDDYLMKAGIFQFKDYMFEHRFSIDRKQCFWGVVGQRFEACSQAGCENHSFHNIALKSCSMFCSLWTRSTRTPNLE